MTFNSLSFREGSRVVSVVSWTVDVELKFAFDALEFLLVISFSLADERQKILDV